MSLTRVSIKSLNFVTTFTFKGDDQKCQICKQDLTAPSLIDQQKSIFTGYKVDIGICGHNFHTACTEAHQHKGGVSCVVDNTIWKRKEQVVIGA